MGLNRRMSHGIRIIMVEIRQLMGLKFESRPMLKGKVLIMGIEIGRMLKLSLRLWRSLDLNIDSRVYVSRLEIRLSLSEKQGRVRIVMKIRRTSPISKRRLRPAGTHIPFSRFNMRVWEQNLESNKWEYSAPVLIRRRSHEYRSRRCSEIQPAGPIMLLPERLSFQQV